MRVQHAAYLLWQVAWGFPQTVAGACVLATCIGKPRFMHHGAVVTIWDSHFGLSLGPFVYMNARSTAPDASGETGEPGAEPKPRFIERMPGLFVDDGLLVHEYGHTVQSLILGPLYLLVIGLPSVIWLRTPRLSRRRRDAGSSYYAFYTERWANHLGENVLKRPSAGMAHID